MVVDIFNTDRKYSIIYADPPWMYRDKMKMKGVHGEIRGAASFYDTMDLSDIKALPIKNIAKENSILFMWITMPMLDKAFQVMEAWGFTYKTCGFCWIKRTKNGKIHLGLGHYTRGNSELCLIGIPDIVRDKIVELMGDLPKIELFARQQAEGWDCWGNEV